MAITRKTWKIVGILFLIGLLIGVFVAYKMYTKPHRDVEAAEAINVEAKKLVSDYESNEKGADSIYLNKVLLVSGTIAEVSKNQEGKDVVSLTGSDMGNVMCTLENNPAQIPLKDQVVKVKGICTGYLTDVVMVRSIIEK